MATFVLDDASVSVNAVDLSDHVRRVRFTGQAAEVNDTNMGDSWENFLSGLKNWTAEIEWAQDFAASEVDATLWPLFSGGTVFECIFKPTSSAVGATNPSWTGNALLLEYSPLDGAVGDLATTTTPLRGTDTLTRATS